MKVAVVGLWHLGLVTAACLAKAGNTVYAYDPNTLITKNLNKGIAPIYEPGLTELLISEKHNLHFSSEPASISQADIIWVNFDTPVDENDHADINFVTHQIEALATYIKSDALILISSQIPVGTTRQLQQKITLLHPQKNLRFGYIPENLRLGKAIQVFTQADRFVIGLQDTKDQIFVEQLLKPFTQHFVWMSIESAEMTKHALNAFLAVSVTFINEIASLCENVGANASEVEAGLKSEERIGIKAYLRAGGAIAGGTLLRDINYLNNISHLQKHKVPLLSAILESNAHHKNWIQRKITDLVKQLKNKTVAVLGLTYKPNTDTLRRSSSIETCQWLHSQGMKVNAFDPAITTLPNEYQNFINLKSSIDDALKSADAIVVATEWADFKGLVADSLVSLSNNPLVIDANAFLFSTLGKDSRIKYCSVGRLT